MRLVLRDGLPFLSLGVSHGGKTVEVSDVLLDTGSASTLLSADVMAEVGVLPSPDETLYFIRGVGGREVVFTRRLGSLRAGEAELHDFEIEVGAMDYGFAIEGILGMDFLTAVGAIVDLGNLELKLPAVSQDSEE
ncbi:MAG: retropepsin-like domain-containing protein [Deltaproteobacteria bacterium]|nr:retropepsin-like domain-containing protein [Deltaproteobacteria bacterium]